MNEFEKHIKLTDFILEMANTGKVPKKWSDFLNTINDALDSKNIIEHPCEHNHLAWEGKPLKIICQKCRNEINKEDVNPVSS